MPDGYFGSLPIPYNVKEDPNALAEEISQLDATKANKSTTINGKSLEANRVIYAQDIPSKNLLPNTASTTTTLGVTFTVNADGSVSCSGTSTGNAVLFVAGLDWDHKASFPLVGGQQYILSGCPSGGSTNTYRMAIWEYNGNTNLDHFDDVGNGVTFTANASANGMVVVITIPSGQNASGLVFRPMIRLTSIEDDSYVPYARTNVELTKDIPNLYRIVKASHTIGALSSGASGYVTLQATIPTGYKTTGIGSVSYVHPGTSKFVVLPSIDQGMSGAITIYAPYYAYGATAAVNSDFYFFMLCVRDDIYNTLKA